MAQSTPIKKNREADLRADFQEELKRLVEAEQAWSPAEGVLRLRALADLSHLLGTEALIELAVAVAVTRSARPSQGPEHKRFQ